LAASTLLAATSVPAQQARAACTGMARIAQVRGALCWLDIALWFQGRAGVLKSKVPGWKGVCWEEGQGGRGGECRHLS
jgi:hypothetical protein